MVSLVDDLQTEKVLVGTAFFLEIEPGVSALITNRHLLEPGYTDKKYKNFKIEKITVSGYHPDNTFYTLLLTLTQEYVVSDNPLNDVACIIRPQCEFEQGVGHQRIGFHFTLEALATEDVFNSSLMPFDELAFSGYPAQHDKIASRPILRGGRISSDPRFDYSYSNSPIGECIAYEGFSSAGASGSAVFAPPRGMGNIPNSRNGYLVGINAGHIITENLWHSGMSYFYKSTVILQIIKESWFDKKG
jgi:hypothetical protein